MSRVADAAQSSLFPPKRPARKLGVAVVDKLVELIVTNELAVGQLLPPEAVLCEHFGVSRTVLRESVKRLEEKGLVVITQGRGTQVNPSGDWNILDEVVLSALIKNDESSSVLDEVTVVRGTLEAVMAGEVARTRTAEALSRIEHSLTAMRETKSYNDAFRQADVAFHFTLMELSHNRLAENIAKNLYRHALESTRYRGLDHPGAYDLTMQEHTHVLDAIAAQDVSLAERMMREHINAGWDRRKYRK